ncbi:hypothetical protein [Halosimplex sp. J119]
MDHFIECDDCGFVLVTEPDSSPVPKRVDSCPDCGGTSFAFPD